MKPTGHARVREWARALKRQSLVVYFVARDPRTPWLARLLAIAVAAYAFSPIDLIPDFIPVLGYLDDLILVPLGVWLVLRLVPAHVLADCRARADEAVDRPVSRLMAVAIVAAWIALLAALVYWACRALRG